MKLADLVDLEWLLRDGAGVQDGAVAAARAGLLRDGVDLAGARARLDGDRALRERLALAFLDAARARDGQLPGRRLARAVELAGWLLVLLGLLAGAGAAKAVLAYDGTTPVNVLYFALVFFAAQIALLVLLVVFLLRTKEAGADGGPALLHRPTAWLVDRLLGARGREVAEHLRALRSRRSLYGAVERWTLFALVQRFGTAFNAAALPVTLLLVVGTDLVFSWSTTLQVAAVDAHRVACWLALPWSFWPDGVPSLATVEASQWVRMPGAFVHGGSLAEAQLLAARWWRFLVAGLVAYGLLPRVLALAFGLWRQRRALAATGLDHAGYHALFDRLLPAAAGFTGPDPASVRGREPSESGPRPATAHAPAQPGAKALLLCWGSLARVAERVRAAAARRFSADVVAALPVGGAALEADAAALRELKRERPRRLVVAFAAGQQPTADALSFVREARQALGAGVPIVALLAAADSGGGLRDAAADEREIWRRSLGALGDPHLWVETLEEPR